VVKRHSGVSSGGGVMGIPMQFMMGTMKVGALYGWENVAVGWMGHLFHSVVFGLIFAGIISIGPPKGIRSKVPDEPRCRCGIRPRTLGIRWCDSGASVATVRRCGVCTRCPRCRPRLSSRTRYLRRCPRCCLSHLFEVSASRCYKDFQILIYNGDLGSSKEVCQ